jgi:hypothetical protein
MSHASDPPPAGVLQAVEQAMQADADAGIYGLQVSSSRVDGEWTYVVINPLKQNGLGAYKFVSILNRIEDRVREQLGQNSHVMLLPASGVVQP